MLVTGSNRMVALGVGLSGRKPPAVADAFLAHCGVQGSRGARCTEIRGDLDSTVFSRWPRAQQPPAPVERLWGKNRVSRWMWMGQQVGHAAGRRLILNRGVPFASCGSSG